MPAFKNRPDRPVRRPAAWLLAALLLGGCGPAQEGGRFELDRLDANWSTGRLDVRFSQRLRLSPEARNALQHGVPLTVGVELVLRDAHTQNRIRRDRFFYEIRYLPLSEHYQLSRLSDDGDDELRTFPRLRHALAELSDLRLSVETGALPGGEYELLARSYLDKRRMPPPMRLPVLFSPRWNHESAWTSTALEIEPGA